MDVDFLTVNIREYLEQGKDGENLLRQILSDFSCEKNADVERFLKGQAIEFTKKNQSVTYLVLTTDDELVGYFSIAIKPITVRTENATFSKSSLRKIARVSEQDGLGKNYSLSAYLIAQLGKNYKDNANSKITGKQLLELAMEKVEMLQYMAGGMVVFLEAEEKEKLMHYYESENGFKRFDKRKTKSEDDDSHTLIQLLKIL